MRNRECGLKCFVRYLEVFRTMEIVSGPIRPAYEDIECWVALNMSR